MQPTPDKVRDLHDAPCPHCGAEAAWDFLNESKTLVGVVCPDCGPFELSRAEFDQAETDITIADPNE